MTHGERRTAAAVAVDLGEDHAGEREALVEGLGRVDGVLAEHGVDHEERFNGLEEGVELGNLLHHRLVDGQTAGRVDDEHVEELASGMVDGGSGNLERLLADGAREPFGARLFGHRLELFDGGRTIDVGGHRENLLALRFDEVLGQLASARRLARALKAGEKDDSGRLGVKIDVAFGGGHVAADDGGELALHDAHQGLAGIEVTDNLFAHGLFLDAGEHFTHDGQGYVGLEKRNANLTQHVLRVFFRQTRLTAHGLDDFGKALA